MPATPRRWRSRWKRGRSLHSRIVLAYSGGLDTSVAIPWLKEQYAAEIVAVTLDLGQGRELSQIRERALAAGAIRCHVLDVREEFARAYVLPALQAGALYEERYPLATAIGRPLIAKKLVEIAHMENAPAIAHGCTAKGNDQVRIDVSARAMDSEITVIAPARVWGMTRLQEIEYARLRNVPVPVTRSSTHSTDQNLWGRSVECGVLEDPWSEAPEEIYTLTKSPVQAPDTGAYVEVEWEKGVPVSINGVAMPLTELIGSLETIAGVHGVGRIDMVENRLIGIKSREIYEAPAAVVLHAAHRELEGLVVPRDLHRLKQRLSQEYADLIRHRPPEALQGRLPGCRPEVAVRALRSASRDLRGRRHLRSLGGRRLHQDLGTSRRDGGKERAAPRSGNEVIDGKSLVRTFQQRPRSHRVSVRVVVQIRQAALRRRRRGQPRVGRGADRGGRLQPGRGGDGFGGAD
jgi:argininosuccinate synthase